MLKSCEQLLATTREQIKEVSWSEVDGLQPDCILIDVREPHELAEASVPGAINIPRGMLEFGIDSHPELQDLDEETLTNSPVVLFCGTGGRSTLAARSLQEIGFRDVRSVRGGLKMRE